MASLWLWSFPGSLKTSCWVATKNSLLKSPLDGHKQEHQVPPVLRKLLHFRQGIRVFQGSPWLRYAYISLPVQPELLSLTRVLGRSGLWLKRRLGIVHRAEATPGGKVVKC